MQTTLTQMSFEQWRESNMKDFDIREKAEIDPYHPDLCHEYTQRVKLNARLWNEMQQRQTQQEVTP